MPKDPDVRPGGEKADRDPAEGDTDHEVDEEIDESFPASDPPSHWGDAGSKHS